MTIRNRLARLERQASKMADCRQACPPGFSPAEWESRQRIGDCLMGRGESRLPVDGYLSGMTPDERAYVDAVWGVVLKHATSLENAGRDAGE